MPSRTARLEALPFLLRLTADGASATSGPGAAIVTPIWEVNPGDWWILLGPPGSGKSKLLAALAGLEPPASGRLDVFGRPAADADTAEGISWRRRVGLVFENGGRLFHQLSVAENVALPLRYHQNLRRDEVWEPVSRLLEFVGADLVAGRTPAELKPALRQRVALARTLALRPDVLLVDNPLAGLPITEMHWWQQALRRLHEGDPTLAGQPLALVLACDDPRPWWDLGTEFAWLGEQGWDLLGDRDAVRPRREALQQQLLAPAP